MSESDQPTVGSEDHKPDPIEVSKEAESVNNEEKPPASGPMDESSIENHESGENLDLNNQEGESGNESEEETKIDNEAEEETQNEENGLKPVEQPSNAEEDATKEETEPKVEGESNDQTSEDGDKSEPESPKDGEQSQITDTENTEENGFVHDKPLPDITIGNTAEEQDNEASMKLETTSPTRKYFNATVDNIQIFNKTFEQILSSKEAKKNDQLKNATQKAIDSLNNLSSRDPHVMYEALKLACELGSNDLKRNAVDLFAKLFDYALFEDESDRVKLTDDSVEVVSACFEGEGTDPEVELQVVRALMHSILLMPTHGASLLKAVRQIYNVFIFSLTPRNQAVAQGILTQVIGTIFQRLNDSLANKSRMSKSSSNLNFKLDESQPLPSEPKEKLTLEALENDSSYDKDRVNEANMASENDEDMAVKDAFLIFRAMCKLSIKDLDTDNVDMKSHTVRSKLLSLHIIHTILKDNIDIFLSKDVVILSSSSDDRTRLIDAVRSYLCQALIKNAASPLAPVFELTLEIYWLLISNLRSDFKMEIPVFWEQIYMPVAEMKTSTPHQKRYLLSIIERLCNDSRCLIEFYLNYDCDSDQPNICEKIIDLLTKLSLSRVEVTSTQKAAYRENGRKGISLYDISKIANLTTSTISSRPPLPDIYNLFPLEYAMKITAINCTVAFLRSLYSWAQKTIHTTSKLSNASNGSRTSLTAGRSNGESPNSSQLNSRNASFVAPNGGSEPPEGTDDPEQFQNLKQRKKAFLDGVRQFAQRPKKGIKFLIDQGFIPSDDPLDIAVFLLNTDSLSKSAIGEYLGEGDEKNIAIMHAFVDQMNFNNTGFVDAMRTFLQSFRLPGEAQKIDRFMLKFAERYVLGNPGVFSNADTAYVLAYSVVMLNTDQHSPQIKNRMTVDGFVANNSGIDDGGDIPRDLLEKIYYEIQQNEIKLQSEQHAALLSGDTSVAPASSAGFFGGRDLNREAYLHASKEMSTKTEKLVRSLGKKNKSDDPLSSVFHAASHVIHVKTIFETLWMSILAGLTPPFKEYDEEDITNTCLEGIKLSIKIACMFDIPYAKKSYISALIQFQSLLNLEQISPKTIAAVYIMLDIAISEGNHLGTAWKQILTSISQLERLQLIAQGVDQDSIPDVSTAKMVNRSSLESTASPGFFSLYTPSQSAAMKYHNQHLSAQAAHLLSMTQLSVAMDKVFTNSAELSGEGIKDFIEALSKVVSEEIESSGLSANPRMFSLQKVVDICYYNMSRIRLEWSQLWAIMGEIFNVVGCNDNINVSFFALDSLRQLSSRFMNIEELAQFKFQKEFLKPFEHIIIHNPSYDVKDMVVECMNNLILANASQIKSGWKTIFKVLTAAAREKKDSLVTKAYKLAFTIHKEYSEEVRIQDSFSDKVECFTQFAKNEKFQKVGLLSLEVLLKMIVKVAHITSESEKSGKLVIGGSENADTLRKLWFPILFGFFDIIMTGEELEVRSRALTHFYDVLSKYGSNFEPSFWDEICHKLLFPIFSVLDSPWNLKYSEDGASSSISERDRISFWVSTTLIQALNSMVSLFTQYFDELTPMLREFLDLLTNCICQENDTIAKTGKACFQDFLIKNAGRLNEEQWDLITDAFDNLFNLTLATELFDLDPLKKQIDGAAEENNADVDDGVDESLDLNDTAETPRLASPVLSEVKDRLQRSKDKSSIVVKCVLQLLMIETVLELSVEEAFYQSISHHHLMKLAHMLKSSHDFATKFNDDYDLRVRLWNAGVIERLPNLLKQESISSAVFLNIMFRLYCDSDKVSTEVKDTILESVVPLSNSIVQKFAELEEANQQKSISTWKPVTIEILRGYVEFDDQDFAKHAPTMYKLVLKILDRGMSQELRRAIQVFLTRVGDAFLSGGEA